jgi:hypothetical protein
MGANSTKKLVSKGVVSQNENCQNMVWKLAKKWCYLKEPPNIDLWPKNYWLLTILWFNWIKSKVKLLRKSGCTFGIVGKCSMNKIIWKWFHYFVDLRCRKYWILNYFFIRNPMKIENWNPNNGTNHMSLSIKEGCLFVWLKCPKQWCPSFHNWYHLKALDKCSASRWFHHV